MFPIMNRRQFILGSINLAAALAVHKIFIPISATLSYRRGIGISDGRFVEDVAALDCDWFYDWSNFQRVDSRYVPMSWAGDNPNLPADYDGYLLVFNEPEVKGQANLDPETASELYLNLCNLYPKARMIVGGCGLFGRNWLMEFRAKLDEKGNEPFGWHAHGYIEKFDTLTHTLTDVISFLTWFKSQIARSKGEFWLTEFNDTYGDQFGPYLDWVEATPWINRYAVFTNRANGGEWWWPQNWAPPDELDMLTWTGQVTPRGELYRARGIAH